jgi:misacylated tRNA(Ala) deacylase
MNDDPTASASAKDYSLPMHTTEHILNQTMVRMFGCKRSQNAHIERKKSKCDYFLDASPTEEQVVAIERKVNEVIDRHLPVTIRMVELEEASRLADLSKLPEGSGGPIRLVCIGDYDVCACIGPHVENTKEIGCFHILNHEFENGRWRMRFKLEER